jgi:hypothetical protein
LFVALESKWVGRNGLAAEELLWDLIRLELIAHHTNATAYFLLAGRERHLRTFYSSPPFLGKPTKAGKYRRLLKLDHRRNPRIRIDTPAEDRKATLKKLLSPYQDLSFPTRITTSRGYSYPQECPTFQYRVYVWEVLAPAGTARFLPKNTKLYKAQNGS